MFPLALDLLKGASPSLDASRLLGEGSLVRVVSDFFSRPKFGSYAASFGRLALLKEAAGKIRVIAIVDPLTQWMLRPLHK